MDDTATKLGTLLLEQIVENLYCEADTILNTISVCLVLSKQIKIEFKLIKLYLFAPKITNCLNNIIISTFIKI